MWIDLTIRPQVEAEVDLQPDNTVELSWPLPDGSRATVLLQPEHARDLNDKMGMRLLMVDR